MKEAALGAGAGAVLGSALIALVVVGTAGAGTPGAPGGFGTTLRPGSVPVAYATLIQQAGTTCQAAPPSILAAQTEAESGWNPTATSAAGAQGIAQFTPNTWATWGKDANGDGRTDIWDPADAIPSQAGYDCALAQQMATALRGGRVTGNVTDLMLAAYNAGPGAVLAAGGVPAFPETRSYVSKITTRAAAFSDTTSSALPAGPFAAKFIAAASSQARVPYAWGGGNFTGPTEGFAQGKGTVGFDCSGLVLYAAYQASGGTIRLPHSAEQQTRTGTPVPLDQLRPGDVISFTKVGAPEAHHVGIYLGNMQMINAPQTGSVVSTQSLNTAYWKGQTWRAVRLGN